MRRGGVAGVVAAGWLVWWSWSRTEVVELPGLDGPLGRQWTGRVATRNGGEVFYWAHAGRPGGAVVWFQGGPGTSSLEGMFHYGGPMSLDGPRDHRPSLTSLGDAYFVEAPAGVGYGRRRKGLESTDETFAEEAADVLCALDLGAYRTVVLAGESYSGVFVPVAARAWLDRDCPKPSRISAYVGNGCVGTRVGPCRGRTRTMTSFRAAHRLGLLQGARSSEKHARTVLAECGASLDDADASVDCRRAFEKASDDVGSRNTFYLDPTLTCPNNNGGESLLDFLCQHRRSQAAWACRRRRESHLSRGPESVRRESDAGSVAASDEKTRRLGLPDTRRGLSSSNTTTTCPARCACVDTRLREYLDRADVKRAVGAPRDEPWRPRLAHRRSVADLVTPGAHRAGYAQLAPHLDALLIASGMNDGQVPFEATAAWVQTAFFPHFALLGQDPPNKSRPQSAVPRSVPDSSLLELWHVQQFSPSADENDTPTTIKHHRPKKKGKTKNTTVAVAALRDAGHALLKYQPEALLALMDNVLF